MSKNKLEKKLTIEERLAMVVGEEAGHHVMNEAITRIRQEQTDRIIIFVQRTIAEIQRLEKVVKQSENQIQFQRRRLAAIEANKFSQPQGSIVIFDESELNIND